MKREPSATMIDITSTTVTAPQLHYHLIEMLGNGAELANVILKNRVRNHMTRYIITWCYTRLVLSQRSVENPPHKLLRSKEILEEGGISHLLHKI